MPSLNILKRSMRENIKVEIYYIDKNENISQRKIQVRTVNENAITAYCLTKRSVRNFTLQNILACSLIKS